MCSAREATNWSGSWQMELDMGIREWPRDKVFGGHINAAATAIEVDVVAATRQRSYGNALSVMSYGSRQLFR